MRLFVAILLPDSIRDGLMNAEDVLRRQGDGNFTLRENLHLTLAFLGETSNLRGAVRAIHAVHAAQLPLTLEKVETIRDLIWMGAEQTPELLALQNQVSQRLTEAGFVLEDRKFRPHLTICRRFHQMEKFCPAAVAAACGKQKMMVTKISLMQSQRYAGRLIYTELAQQALTIHNK